MPQNATGNENPGPNRDGDDQERQQGQKASKWGHSFGGLGKIEVNNSCLIRLSLVRLGLDWNI